MKIHSDVVDDTVHQIGYKVVTKDLRSLGLRNNPNIMEFPIETWVRLPEDMQEESKRDWGGIWVARVPSGATKLRQYMREHHDIEARIFKAAIADILYINDYRIKTSGVCMYEEIQYSQGIAESMHHNGFKEQLQRVSNAP